MSDLPERVIRAAAEVIVPDTVDLDDADWTELLAVIDLALSDRPPRVRQQIALFLRVLDLAPLIRHGRRFHALDRARRHRVLDALQTSPLLLLRRGVWGVRTLVFMGYYTRPAAARRIGYRADAMGWSAPHRTGP